jgi:APA family basic amino acid/polyamine antiporter
MAVDQSDIAPPSLLGTQPRRVLGTFDAACVVIGAIVGVGIFFTPSEAVRLTGSGGLAMAAWALGGLIALCGALTFAELGARFNAAGAQYDVIRTAWGSLAGFVFVFCIATVIVPGATAIIAIICAKNLGVMLGIDLEAIDTSVLERLASSIGWQVEPGAFNAVPTLSVSAALVIGLMIVNLLGAKWGSGIQNLTVFAKVATLLAVTALAAGWASAPAREAAAVAAEQAGVTGAGLAPITGVLAALVPVFFSYGGWQQALWISGEVRDPRRTLPRAIIGGTIVVIIIYLLANWAYLRLLGAPGVMASDALAADAVGTVAPTFAGRVVAGAVAISAFGILNVEFLTGPRLTYAMSRAGYFFPTFGRLHWKFGTPAAAIILLGGVTLALLIAAGENGVNYLLTGVMAVDALFFVLTGAALFVLRRNDQGIEGTRDQGIEGSRDRGIGSAVHPPPSEVEESPGRRGGEGVGSAYHSDAPPPTPQPSPSGRERESDPNAPVARGVRGFRVPFYPRVPAFFVLGEIGVVTGAYLDPDTRSASIVSAIWVGVGVVIYLAWFRKRR